MKQERNEAQASNTSYWKAAAIAAALTMTLVPLTSIVSADPLQDALNAADDAACGQAVVAGLACAPEGRLAWSAGYDGGEAGTAGYASARAIAVSPDESRVFVAGANSTFTTVDDYVILAYDAVTGGTLWERAFSGASNGYDWPESVAVSPDGATVFVTGFTENGARSVDYATVAYDAATGDELWVAHYGTNGIEFPSHLTVSPDGSRVYVTGAASDGGWGSDFGTVAYDAATGSEVWTASYNSPANGYDYGWRVAASTDGSQVFVTGPSAGASNDYATVAYDAATGHEQWTARYDHDGRTDVPAGIGVSPDGTHVYVTGESWSADTRSDYATVAYDAVDGTRAWVARYDGPTNHHDIPSALAVDPDGDRVYVTGRSANANYDYATVAYDAADGAEAWVARHDGPDQASDYASGLTVTPDGSAVIVTGASGDDYGTLAYDATDGSLTWTSRYDGGRDDAATALAAGPAGDRVYVTGTMRAEDGGVHFMTLAYATKAGIEVPL